jgi:hypothetical protein
MELSGIRFVDTAGVHPAILYAIFRRSVHAEADFGVATLVLASAVDQLVIRDLLAFGPGVR